MRDVAGVKLRLDCQDADVRASFELDFAAFPCVEGQPDLVLSAQVADYRPPLGLKERFRGPSGVVFNQGHVRFRDGVWVLERSRVIGPDREALAFRLALTALSRVGEILDGRGLHRVHALGLARGGAGMLLLLPPGGGKSTLALRMLGEWSLLSEDTPLVDRRGRLHPFPYRLGLREEPQGLASRPASNGKFLVRADAFPVAKGPLLCRNLLVGAWTTGSPFLEPARGLPYLARDMVVGLGLPQVSELFLRGTWGDLASKALLAAGRTLAALRLLARARCQRVYLGPDPEENAAFLSRVLRP